MTTETTREQATYNVYIEATVVADNDEDADAIAKRLAERAFEHSCVIDIEASAVRGTEPAS